LHRTNRRYGPEPEVHGAVATLKDMPRSAGLRPSANPGVLRVEFRLNVSDQQVDEYVSVIKAKGT
jgi:hypothetical protein